MRKKIKEISNEIWDSLNWSDLKTFELKVGWDWNFTVNNYKEEIEFMLSQKLTDKKKEITNKDIEEVKEDIKQYFYNNFREEIIEAYEGKEWGNVKEQLEDKININSSSDYITFIDNFSIIAVPGTIYNNKTIIDDSSIIYKL